MSAHAQAPNPSVITIGTFDGVHTGHRALIHAARDIASQSASQHPNTRVVALAFDPHPMTRLRPDHVPERLSTWDQRAAWLRDAGADIVERIDPTDTLLSLSPEAFIQRCIERHNPIAFVEGSDFHFGAHRAGNVRTLAALAEGYNFTARIVPPVEVVLENQLIARASSSLVRWLLRHRRVTDAAIVLGRPYQLVGTVVRGDRLGRTIGFPTANIETPCMLPADAVYAGFADLPDGRRLAAAINVGTRPTVKGQTRRLEAHLFDPAGAPVPRDADAILGVPEYDWPISLSFTRFIRDQARFESLAHLADQLHRDLAAITQRAALAGTTA